MNFSQKPFILFYIRKTFLRSLSLFCKIFCQNTIINFSIFIPHKIHRISFSCIIFPQISLQNRLSFKMIRLIQENQIGRNSTEIIMTFLVIFNSNFPNKYGVEMLEFMVVLFRRNELYLIINIFLVDIWINLILIVGVFSGIKVIKYQYL